MKNNNLLKRSVPIPDNEKARLRSLNSYIILDTYPEEEFDSITKLASNICKMPIALISFVDEKRLWFKSKVGIELKETKREISFCQYTIMDDCIYEVRDASKDKLFAQNPLVTSGPALRFYAGAPLIDLEGYTLGSLCVLDTKPGKLNSEQKESLQLLANSIVAQLRLRKCTSELIESRRMLKNFFHLAPDFMFTASQDGYFLNVNSSFNEKLGYAKEELLNKSFFQFIHPNDFQSTLNELTRQYYGEQTIEFENRYRKKDGTYIWVSWNTIPDPANGLVYATGRDVTERKHSQLQVKQSEESLNNAQLISKIGSWEFNLETQELKWSKELYRIFEMEEMPSSQLFELCRTKILPDDIHLIDKAIDEAANNGLETKVEHRILCNDGNIKHLLGIGKVYKDEYGKAAWIKGTFQDVTERKKIERELVRAKEIAERAVVVKDTFLTNMSHEIRTPMNAIIGFTDLLSQTNLDDAQKEFIESVKVAGDNLLSIINDILDFSRIESGKISIDNKPFRIRDTMRHVYKLLKVKADEKKLEFNFSIDADFPEVVCGDSIRLSQVMINLAGNAIKFTESGSIKVSVNNFFEDESAFYLKFSVKDSGIGIPVDMRESIFERFIQVDDDVQRKYGGTGLGLSISRNLVELMGGKLSVQSKVNEGSEFSFEIKFQKERLTNIELIPVTTTKRITGKCSVLVFEDNVLNQRLVKNVLDNFGFETEVVSGGKMGLETLLQKNFDILLMDLQMPDMDGYRVTEVIRNDLKIKTPIIAMTAHSMSGEKEKCISYGMNDYISKPFKQEELYQKISDLLLKASEIIAIDTESESIDEERKIINLEYLKELSSGNQGFEKEMLEIFLSKVSSDIELLQIALDRKDFIAVRGQSHELMSSIPIAGLNDIEPVLKEIEIEAGNKIINAETHSKFEKIKMRIFGCFPEIRKRITAYDK